MEQLTPTILSPPHKKTHRYRVIKDTREHKGKGWYFDECNKCLGTSQEALKTGDYTLEHIKDKFVIERKGSVGEWAGNVFEDRFFNELERLNNIKHAYIILEFTIEELLRYPANLKIPMWKKRRIRATGKHILSRTLNMHLDFPNITFLFVGNDGKLVANRLFSEMTEKYPVPKPRKPIIF